MRNGRSPMGTPGEAGEGAAALRWQPAESPYRGQAGPPGEAGAERCRLETRVSGREPELVGLITPEQQVPRDAGLDAVADRMGQQHRADRIAVPSRVAAGLVVPIRAPEAEAVPGRDGASVDLK